MTLTDLDFGRCAAGQVAALHLESGGKLLLRLPCVLAELREMTPHAITVLPVHEHHSIRTKSEQSFS